MEQSVFNSRTKLFLQGTVPGSSPVDIAAVTGSRNIKLQLARRNLSTLIACTSTVPS